MFHTYIAMLVVGTRTYTRRVRARCEHEAIKLVCAAERCDKFDVIDLSGPFVA